MIGLPVSITSSWFGSILFGPSVKQNNNPPVLAKLWKNATLCQGHEDQSHCWLIVFVSRSDSYFMSLLSPLSAGTGCFLQRAFPKSVPLLKLDQE
jgi:hypothetical protein